MSKDYIFIFLLSCGMAFVFVYRSELTRGRPSDHPAIDEFMVARHWRTIAVTRDDHYWRYWIRGKLGLSNCARIYVIVAERPGGDRREVHVAFDPWPWGDGQLQVLAERDAPGK